MLATLEQIKDRARALAGGGEVYFDLDPVPNTIDECAFNAEDVLAFVMTGGERVRVLLATPAGETLESFTLAATCEAELSRDWALYFDTEYDGELDGRWAA